MGGEGSKTVYHTTTVYRPDPETAKKLAETEKKLEKIEEEAIKQKSPEHFVENLFNNFNDISMVSWIIKTVYKINLKSLVIVRTKVDQNSTNNERTIEEEKKLDKEKVKLLLDEELETYCISSFNIRDGKEKHDWDELDKSAWINKLIYLLFLYLFLYLKYFFL